VSIFDRFGTASGRHTQASSEVGKVIDGQHPGRKGTADGAVQPDMLPLPENGKGDRAAQPHSIIVAVTGSEMDREIVSTACTLAKLKNVKVFAIYGIEVPRTLQIDDPMIEQTQRANDALDQAVTIAKKLNVDIEPEIVQSRHFGQSLLEESKEHNAVVIILGAPYHLRRDGQFDLGETAEYLMKNAPCKLWLVRGQPPAASEQPDRAARNGDRASERSDERTPQPQGVSSRA
jgi:nucleotide-binding universal stress UspA family protein